MRFEERAGHGASPRVSEALFARLGIGEGEIEAIAQPERWAAVFPAAEVAVLDLATRLCHNSHDLDRDLIDRLIQHYSERQLAELILVAGQANLNNRVGNAAKQLFGGR